jgi:hypothetical protein
MNPTGLYLYGFIPRAGNLELSGINGIDADGPVRALDLGSSRAVVGSVRVEAFEAAMSSGVDGGPDPSWIIPRALKHQAILGEVLDRSPVLPARFGTLFSSTEALEGLAKTHQRAIARFFDDLGDRREWSLRGYHDPDGAVELLLEADPNLSSRRRALPESPGTRYFLEKKLREEARRVAAEAARHAADEVRRALRALTGDVRSLPLRGVEAPGREMVLHETFLLPPAATAEALAAVEWASASTVAGLLTLEPSGPWPPFHFCPDLGGDPT